MLYIKKQLNISLIYSGKTTKLYAINAQKFFIKVNQLISKNLSIQHQFQLKNYGKN